jgi:hypothetical protein
MGQVLNEMVDWPSRTLKVTLKLAFGIRFNTAALDRNLVSACFSVMITRYMCNLPYTMRFRPGCELCDGQSSQNGDR